MHAINLTDVCNKKMDKENFCNLFVHFSESLYKSQIPDEMGVFLILDVATMPISQVIKVYFWGGMAEKSREL